MGERHSLAGDVTLDLADASVAVVEMHRPPENYFDVDVIGGIAEALHRADRQAVRAVVLCAEGKHFCAGANFFPGRSGTDGSGTDGSGIDGSGIDGGGSGNGGELYERAAEIFRSEIPLVAAMAGAAVGGGMGLALACDFRVAAADARLSANFARLGFHHGFGMTETLPAVVGQQKARELLFTGRRVPAPEALAIGLVDRVVEAGTERTAAVELAHEIAASAPLAVRRIRATLRGDLPTRVAAAMEHELREQQALAATADFREGIAASLQRRPPKFTGS